MVSRVLYLFYSEEEFPLTKSVTPTRPRHRDSMSVELLYYPSVWLLLSGDYYRLDFKSIDTAREVLSSSLFFNRTLRKHTTKVVKHDEYVKKFER